MSRKEKFKPAMNICPKYVLKDSEPFISLLLKVETSNIAKNYSKKIIGVKISDAIRKYDKQHLKRLKNIRKGPIDISLHLSVNKRRYKKQDLDNIQKVVFDAIKEDKNNFKKEYLIKDDSQIIRSLVYKTKKIEKKYYDTDQLTLSYRKHDPAKQMILIKQRGIYLTIRQVK